MKYMKDRINDMLKQADLMARQIAIDEAHVRIAAAAHRHYSPLDRRDKRNGCHCG